MIHVWQKDAGNVVEISFIILTISVLLDLLLNAA